MSISGESSHQLLQLMFDNSSELVLAQDETQRTVFANRPLRKFLGTAKDQPDWEKIIAAFEHNPKSTSQNNQIDCADSVNDAIASIENASGELRTLRQNKKELTLSNGQSFQVGIYTDLTPLIKANKKLEDQKRELEHKNKAMDALNKIAIELIDRTDLSQLLQRVVNNAAKITGAEYAFIAMVHESGDYLETAVANDGPEELISAKLKRGEGLAGEVWRSKKTIVVKDYKNHPTKLPGREFVIQSGAVPIMIGKEVVGVLGVIYKQIEPKIDCQIELLEKFALLVAVAIENTNLHENTRSDLIRTEVINELSHDIHSSTDFQFLLENVCKKMISAFSVAKAHIYRYNETSGYTPLVAWEDLAGKMVPAKQTCSLTTSSSIASWCIQNQEMAFIKRGEIDHRESPEIHQVRKKLGLGSTVCIPLVHNGASWGVLFAHRRIEQKNFSKNDINLFKIIGNQASIALHRQDLLQRVQHQAHHDSLTDLPNRLKFEITLNEILSSSSNTSNQLKPVVLSLDLDGFKAVNDNHGHAIGDEILKNVVRRIRATLEPHDMLARIGGDEFAIIIAEYKRRADIVSVAEQLVDSLGREFTINGIIIQISASASIVFAPADATDATRLLKNADIAIYNAKFIDKGQVTVFSQSDADQFESRLRMERDLKTAIKEKQFELYYQPKVSCESGCCDSVEALIRWHHPRFGFVSPLEFISVAEESGLIQKIGTWVIDEACRQGANYLKTGTAISIAVNISAQQFIRNDFVDTVFSLIEKHNFRPELLELEVTESVVMKDIELVVTRLTELRHAGIKIAIDDFGTGYSSLKYLEDLPLDVLKIDKAFVDKLDINTGDKSLVKTIVLMARSFNLVTVAEGVETEQQKATVQQLGCDFIQGYLYSKPVSADELPGVLEKINDPLTELQAA